VPALKVRPVFSVRLRFIFKTGPYYTGVQQSALCDEYVVSEGCLQS